MASSSTREAKRTRRYFDGMSQEDVADTMADMDYVWRWTMAVAMSLKPIKTAPSSVADEIQTLRKTGWRLSADDLEERACRIRWRIKTEWPRGAASLLKALNRCVDDVRLTELAVSSACSDALFGLPATGASTATRHASGVAV